MTDRRISLASAAWGRAKASDDDARRDRWTCAAMAYVCDHDALVKSLSITPAAVGQMASGYSIFVLLRTIDALRARQLRRKHTYSRFYSIGLLWAQYEFDPALMFDYLESDDSLSAILAEITNRHDSRPEWHRRGLHILPTLRKFRDDYEAAPEDVRECARQFADALERYVR